MTKPLHLAIPVLAVALAGCAEALTTYTAARTVECARTYENRCALLQRARKYRPTATALDCDSDGRPDPICPVESSQ